MATTIKINGVDRTVDVDGDTPLLWVLRDVLGMTGTKFGCGIALCGACTVHIDRTPRRSCITPISSIRHGAVTTIAAIDATQQGKALQKASLDLDVVQCGYCQSGQIMPAAALLMTNPKPSDADVDAVMSGIVCRCATNQRIRAAFIRPQPREREDVQGTSISSLDQRHLLKGAATFGGGLVLSLALPPV